MSLTLFLKPFRPLAGVSIAYLAIFLIASVGGVWTLPAASQPYSGPLLDAHLGQPALALI